MEYQRASAATAFSKKLSNGRSFNGKNMYDGVLGGGQSKVGSRVEDYAEIFGGGSGSSIPFLDVPELKERKFLVDVSSSKLDYSNIFSGFENIGFAVSHEELIAKPKRESKKIPAKTRTYSEGSLIFPSNVKDGNQVSSNGQTSPESGIGVKQLKMSYNKSSPGSKNGTNGMTKTYVTQLHAVPGYTHMIDEKINPSTNVPDTPVVNETYPTKNSGEGAMEDMHKKPASEAPASGIGKQTSIGVDVSHGRSRSNASDFNDVLFGSYDFGHRTPPKVPRTSSMLNNIGGKKCDSLKFGVPRSHSLDYDAGVSSPPYFDDELDANSVAATSAAAVKKAIEEAQAKLKIAKELMEKRKEGNVSHIKPSVNGGLKGGERKKGKDTAKQNNSRQDKAQATGEKIDAFMQTYAGVRKQNVIKVDPVTAESGDKIFAAGRACEKNFISSPKQGKFSEKAELREAPKQGEREKEVMQTQNEYEREEKKVTEQPQIYCEKSEAVEEASEQDFQRKLDSSKELCNKDECLNMESNVESHDQKEDEAKLRFSELGEETGKRMSSELKACERKLKGPEKAMEDEIKIEIQEPKNIDYLESLKVYLDVDNAEKYSHAVKQEQNGSLSQDVFEKEENEMLPPEISPQKEFEMRFEAFERSEMEEYKEVYGPEENKEEEDTCIGDENEQISDRIYKPEIIDLGHDNFDHEEEIQRNLAEIGDLLGNEEFMEAEETEDVFEDAYQLEAVEEEHKEAPESVETDEMQKQTDSEADLMTKAREDALECFEEDPEAGNDSYEFNEMNNAETVEPSMNEYVCEMIPHLLVNEENRPIADGIKAYFEFMEAEETEDVFEDAYQLEAVEEEHKEAPESVETDEMQKQTDSEADLMTKAREDALECFEEDPEAGNDSYEFNEMNNAETVEPSMNEYVCEMIPHLLVNEENRPIADGIKAYFECEEPRRYSAAVGADSNLEENLVFDKADLAESNFKLNEIEQQSGHTTEAFDFDKNGIHIDTTSISFKQKQYEQHSKESEIICALDKLVFELVLELEDDVREAEVGLEQGENKHKDEFPDEGRLIDSQLHSDFAEKHETKEVPHEVEISPRTENNEEIHHEPLVKGQGENENDSEEVELVKERQRRVDEAKEREREREKERIAVERAIREARQRAFADARERAAAGKANLEARRKVKAEAQGESAKPSAEANGKAFMEAKLKAERAAVERATVEARQRALEKALSEKGGFGARNQAEKVSESKQSFQSYDSRYKGSGPSATGRYPTTNQSALNSSNGSDGATGESAQRCKARLERHQRTAERAAKALAEKNKRDLLAQKEQAERNRLAETLDAEVKRWSSGKQGNLRALLSTLQYILGPDSGWQPVPLTDIIATAAVKKAYRKATLCVHPDKLQQRGASIPQKYTCEKVFDLLKEAWNKFSSEER